MDNNNISMQKNEPNLVKDDCDNDRFRRYLSQVCDERNSLSQEKKIERKSISNVVSLLPFLFILRF